MNIKSVLIAISISPVSLSAADIHNDSAENSPFSNDSVNILIKSLQTEIYDLVDAQKNQEAQTLYNFSRETLDPLLERMDELKRCRAEERLALIEQYMDDYEQFPHD